MIDLKEFREIFLALGYDKGTYAYTAGVLEKANERLLSGYSKEKAVKSALNSEGLYCPKDR